MNTPNIEETMRNLFAAAPDLREAALEAADAVLRGSGQANQASSPRMSFQEVARALGKTAPTLHRLGVNQNCGMAFAGGRKTYTVGEVEAYLASPEAMRHRAAWRAQRKTWKS